MGVSQNREVPRTMRGSLLASLPNRPKIRRGLPPPNPAAGGVRRAERREKPQEAAEAEDPQGAAETVAPDLRKVYSLAEWMAQKKSLFTG